MLAVVVLIPLAAFEAVADSSDRDARIQPIPAERRARHRTDGHARPGDRAEHMVDALDRANPWPISLRSAGARWSSDAFVGARRGHRGRP